MIEQALSAALHQAAPVLLSLTLVAAAIRLTIWWDSDIYELRS
jgi:hypothetical protein